MKNGKLYNMLPDLETYRNLKSAYDEALKAMKAYQENNDPVNSEFYRGQAGGLLKALQSFGYYWQDLEQSLSE